MYVQAVCQKGETRLMPEAASTDWLYVSIITSDFSCLDMLHLPNSESVLAALFCALICIQVQYGHIDHCTTILNICRQVTCLMLNTVQYLWFGSCSIGGIFAASLIPFQELKGGKTFQKLGYVDLNMASYAGQGHITRSFILQGYNEKHRLDNSILRIGIHLTLTSGDPLFKTWVATVWLRCHCISDWLVWVIGCQNSRPHSPSSNGYPIDSDNVCSGDLTEANKGEMPAELSDTTERKGY